MVKLQKLTAEKRVCALLTDISGLVKIKRRAHLQLHSRPNTAGLTLIFEGVVYVAKPDLELISSSDHPPPASHTLGGDCEHTPLCKLLLLFCSAEIPRSPS